MNAVRRLSGLLIAQPCWRVSRPLRPTRIALCLVLGLATTLCCGWLLTMLVPALGQPSGSAFMSLMHGRGSALSVTRFESWGGFGFAAMSVSQVGGPEPLPAGAPEMRALVPAWAYDAAVASFEDSASAAWHVTGMWCVEARGFPFAAVWCAYDSPVGPGKLAGKPTVHGGLLGPDTLRRPNSKAFSAAVVLPVRPIWRGLLTDCAIYGVLWWVVLAAPRLRSYLRFQRGHCIRCNYNLSGLAPASPCPECGFCIPRRPEKHCARDLRAGETMKQASYGSERDCGKGCLDEKSSNSK
jgi:hypothetical protein